MTATTDHRADTYLYAGIRWHQQSWFHRLFADDGTTCQIPGHERLIIETDSRAQWCLGFTDYTAPGPGIRRRCPSSAALRINTQCVGCRIREGLDTIGIHRGPVTNLPENIIDYYARPWLVYAAAHLNGRISIGAVAHESHDAHFRENAVLIAHPIAQTPDGLDAHRLRRTMLDPTTGRRRPHSAHAVLPRTLPNWRPLADQVHRAAGRARADVPSNVRTDSPVWLGGHRFHQRLINAGIETIETLDTPAAYVLHGDDALGHILVSTAETTPSHHRLVDVSRIIGRRIIMRPDVPTAELSRVP